MREGIEKVIYDKFNELLQRHEKPAYAVSHLNYLVFVENAEKFYELNEEQQMEVRCYLKAIELLHGRE